MSKREEREGSENNTRLQLDHYLKADPGLSVDQFLTKTVKYRATW